MYHNNQFPNLSEYPPEPVEGYPPAGKDRIELFRQIDSGKINTFKLYPI